MRKPANPSFDTAMANLRNSINTRTITGQYLADRVDELESAHEREVKKLMASLEANGLELEALSATLDMYMPHDRDGKPVCPGDFVEVHGELYYVDGVDTDGGIFFQSDVGWDYTLARLHRRVTIDLDPDDGRAPDDLWELALEIREKCRAIDEGGGQNDLRPLVGRLVQMADASRRALR